MDSDYANKPMETQRCSSSAWYELASPHRCAAHQALEHNYAYSCLCLFIRIRSVRKARDHCRELLPLPMHAIPRSCTFALSQPRDHSPTTFHMYNTRGRLATGHAQPSTTSLPTFHVHCKSAKASYRDALAVLGCFVMQPRLSPYLCGRRGRTYICQVRC